MSVYKWIIAAHTNGMFDLDCGHSVYRKKQPMGALLLCGVCNPELEERRLDQQLTSEAGRRRAERNMTVIPPGQREVVPCPLAILPDARRALANRLAELEQEIANVRHRALEIAAEDAVRELSDALLHTLAASAVVRRSMRRGWEGNVRGQVEQEFRIVGAKVIREERE